MTPKEINAAIAESVNAEDAHWECPNCGRVEGSHVSFEEFHAINSCLRRVNWVGRPDYHGSLDAIVPVVRALPEEERESVWDELQFSVMGDRSTYECALTTPAQWCEAYLKWKGLWKLEPEPAPHCIDGEGHDYVPLRSAPDGTEFAICTKCGRQSE